MSKSLIELLLAVCIPVAGSVGYMHGTFATKNDVETNKASIIRVDKLICKMAISQGIKNAESICTD
tara:strand:- start:4049 stop:4246 length:198 start_codon:yes stop_codon:yes gene_type:complete